MKPRHLLTVRNFTSGEILDLIRHARELKNHPGKQGNALSGKTLGLLFLKPSVRTRVSFEVGMAQLGGQALYMGPLELGGHQREAAKDLARVLSRYLDGIVCRTFAQKDLEALAEVSDIPVVNGLSDWTHPCQALGDLLTLQERFGKLKGVRIAYVGDGNNVCHALIEAAALTGLNLSIATPPGYGPPPETVRWAKGWLSTSSGRLSVGRDPRQAVKDAQVVYTDVWTSMGQEQERAKRMKAFGPYQVNRPLIRLAASNALFMHCLPAHRGQEVTDEVLDSQAAIVYDQAENRLHVQKAILLKLLK